MWGFVVLVCGLRGICLVVVVGLFVAGFTCFDLVWCSCLCIVVCWFDYLCFLFCFVFWFWFRLTMLCVLGCIACSYFGLD